eukprot:scaffold1419_cov95-Isochrysis_galbana.AAC.1
MPHFVNKQIKKTGADGPWGGRRRRRRGLGGSGSTSGGGGGCIGCGGVSWRLTGVASAVFSIFIL